MAKQNIVLPPNWRLVAINWAARNAGMNYGDFSESVVRHDPVKAQKIEEEFKEYYFAMKQAEYDRLAENRAKRQRNLTEQKGEDEVFE